MEREYSIIACGRSYNPPDWYYNPKNLVNRIYYICGGTAYYRGDVRLKPGHLYIFRGSPYFQVGQDENDPVDHVFFDFIYFLGDCETLRKLYFIMHIVQNHTVGTVSPSALSDGVHDGARCCNVGTTCSHIHNNALCR